jgi:hypothetical protein
LRWTKLTIASRRLNFSEQKFIVHNCKRFVRFCRAFLHVAPPVLRGAQRVQQILKPIALERGRIKFCLGFR